MDSLSVPRPQECTVTGPVTPALLIVDSDGVIRAASHPVGAILDRNAAALPGRRLQDVVADSSQRVNEILTTCLAGGGTTADAAVLTSLGFKRESGGAPIKCIVGVRPDGSEGPSPSDPLCRVEIHAPNEEPPSAR